MGAGALVLGFLISPMLATFLPFGLDARVAAFIMRTDRWHAGAALMAADSPTAWADLAAAAQLLKPTTMALEACREAAVRTRKEQHCSLVVPAP